MSGLRIQALAQRSASVSVNCYLVFDEATGEAAVIDPGGQAENVCSLLKAQSCSLKYIILTHGQFDHIMCTAELSRITGAPICMNIADEAFIRDSHLNAADFVKIRPIEPFSIDKYLNEGDRVFLGKSFLTVLETPGHTPGGISLYMPGYLICGDTILRGTTGRMDLPGADPGLIRQTIREKIFALPNDTIIFCGHNASTTVSYEKENNNAASTQALMKGTST